MSSPGVHRHFSTPKFDKEPEFLHLRDSREDFQAVKEGRYVGIPCFLFEDGSLTFSVEEAIVWSGKAK